MNGLLHGGDYFNRRFSVLGQVKLETINELKPVWVIGASLES